MTLNERGMSKLQICKKNFESCKALMRPGLINALQPECPGDNVRNTLHKRTDFLNNLFNILYQNLVCKMHLIG